MAEGRESVINEMRKHLNCPICMEEEQLRMLPCQHSICLACLDQIISTASSQGRRPLCPYCQEVLSKAAREYPNALLANSLQEEFDRLAAATKERTLDDDILCDSAGCKRPVDWRCKDCKAFICQRCSSKGSCSASKSCHNLVDFLSLKEQSKEGFELWKTGKRAEIESLKQKRKQLDEQMQREVASADPDKVDEVFTKHEKLHTAKQIQAMKVMEDGAASVLDYYSTDMDKVMDTDFIKLVEQLSIGLKEQTTLGKCDTVSADWCYSVEETPTNLILAGRDESFTVHNSEGSVVRNVAIANRNVVSIRWYKGCIYTLCNEPVLGIKREVVVFDGTEYTELRRWSVPDYKYISQLAVTNDKVYVADTEHKQVCVYSLTGDTDTPITHSTCSGPNRLAVSHPECLIISDYLANRFHLLRKNRTIRWTSSSVVGPMGVYQASLGDVWVWSRRSKSLLLLSSQSGEVIREVNHPKFADIKNGDDILDMCMTSSKTKLWVAARCQGLLRFDLQ